MTGDALDVETQDHLRFEPVAVGFNFFVRIYLNLISN